LGFQILIKPKPFQQCYGHLDLRLQAAAASTPEVTEQPEWVRGGRLYPHQLDGINWLRRQWAADRPVAVGDDVGLGKTATVIAFLQFLRWVHSSNTGRRALHASALGWGGCNEEVFGGAVA